MTLEGEYTYVLFFYNIFFHLCIFGVEYGGGLYIFQTKGVD